MAQITVTQCDHCKALQHTGTFHVAQPIPFTPVEADKPAQTPQTTIPPGDYCVDCMVRMAQTIAPKKIMYRSPTQAIHNATITTKCSMCDSRALYKIIAQDSDLMGYLCEDCKPKHHGDMVVPL